MTHIDELKERIIQQAVEIGRQRLSASQQGLVEKLIRASYANVAPEDVLKRDPDTLFGGSAALLDFMSERKPGEPKLRVYLPRYDDAGWDCDHGVIEIINDDMPFLVDSLSAALQKHDIDIHLLVHPIFSVARDEKGRLTGIAETIGERGHHVESVMHVEIDRLAAATDPKTLEKDLLAVFAEVRAAVEDWQSMRKVALQEIDGLKTAHVPDGAGDLVETRDFLQWMCDNNFTFLGMRAYTFGGKDKVGVVKDSSLGLLRDESIGLFDSDAHATSAGPEVDAFLRQDLLVLTKGDRISTVHRAVQLDVVGIKRFDTSGKVIGMLAIAGLYGHSAYALSTLAIPVLRKKVRTIVERAGFSPTSHDGKQMLAILEGYPRDELVQASEDLLFEISLGILRLQGRQQVALFLRPDDLGRFVSALVFVPRERYDTKLRQRWSEVLEDAFGGTVVTWFAQVADNPLARLHFVVRKKDQALKNPAVEDLEKRLADAARSWADRLREALLDAHGEEKGLSLYRRWGDLFPVSYREMESPRAALGDIDQLANLGGKVGVHLHRPLMSPETEVHFKLYHKAQPVALSDVLPLFEHMGFRVISENPHELRGGSEVVWIHDFTMATLDGTKLNVEKLRHRFEDAFLALWNNDAEDDGLNKLLVGADLGWRQIAILRAYAKYLRQAGSTFSGSYVERSVVGNPTIARLLVQLFECRFDPAGKGEDAAILAAIDTALDSVTSADEDRILRRFLNLIDCTLRTNYFQKTPEGGPKTYISVKLDSQKVQGLPLPRPNVEVFVYSPRMEGIHLRGGKVARGGIRWSDRPEDFRTEILGLIKAQMVKNAVIVPVGSKGGFVVKRPPAGGGREAMQAEGIACYQILMRGLLDLTDNLVGGDVVPPRDVVRRDEDDPYLVVAADKGTATFSDIANGVSAEYGFWLGDAFASGGSVGYDHKVMGITARGAWVSVERHFREMNRDCQKEDFTAIGIGDMSGDVFGNGMLRSKHTRLLAAFDHRHIFIDPDPNPARSFAERERMFALPRSSWADYDTKLISKGGGIYPRDAKTVTLSEEACAALGLPSDPLTPPELIRHLLCAEVDLLWFGGIGTYVKSSSETHAEVGDRANESLRVDGNNLRCKVIGEGANLGVTQLGRIEAALNGVRMNTDAIDNSAGVDCSDHEVNIKILLNDAVANGDMTLKQRNELLAKMTDDVGLLVLRDNYLQTQALSIFETQSNQLADQQMRYLRMLAVTGRLNRAIEFLPTDEELKKRLHGGTGLTRPELSVLLAYSKMWLYDAVLASDLPDDPVLVDDLVRYFPPELRNSDEWRARMDRHRLKREIIATSAVNSMVNRIGGSFVFRMMERFGASPEEVVRAYLVTRDAFAIRDVWEAIEELDGKVPAQTQITLLLEGNRLIDRGIAWIMNRAQRPIDMGKLKTMLAPAIDLLRNHRESFMPPDSLVIFEFRADQYINSGMPEELAHRVAGMILLVAAGDIATIALKIGSTVERVAQLYFRVSSRFGLGWLRAAADNLPDGGPWQRLAVDAVIDDLYVHQGELTANIVTTSGSMPPEEALAVWIEQRRPAVERVERLLGEMRTAGSVDLATLVVAGHHLRGLASAQTP